MSSIPLAPVINTRPGWLVRLAVLSRELVLIGAIRDSHVDNPNLEAAITYGFFNVGELQRIESAIGPIGEAIEKGDTHEVHVDLRTGRLIDIKLLVVEEEVFHARTPAAFHCCHPDSLTENDYTPSARAEIARQQEQRAIFEQRRQRALTSRLPTWRITEAKHRADLGFLPAVAIQWVKRESRDYLFLPEAPTPVAPSTPPPLALSVEQKASTEQVMPGGEVPPHSSQSWFERMRRAATI